MQNKIRGVVLRQKYLIQLKKMMIYWSWKIIFFENWLLLVFIQIIQLLF